jgi:hypothetical protein
VTLTTDNGTQFISSRFLETLGRLGVRITVRENKRERIRSPAALMDEVNADVVQCGLEMSESI